MRRNLKMALWEIFSKQMETEKKELYIEEKQIGKECIAHQQPVQNFISKDSNYIKASNVIEKM